jgi:hypothetical protein
MKIARYLSMTVLGLVAVTTRASADSSASDPANNPSDPADSPYAQYDPDGVPLSVTQPQSAPLTQDEIKAIHKQQQEATLDKDWLLRNYEQQLQARAAANPSEEQGANLYYELSSNKDLAKLAGLPALDSDRPDSTAPATRLGQGPVTLRSDASSKATSNSLSRGYLLKPLVTPFSAPDAAGLHNFYSSLPGSRAPSFFGNRPQTPPAPNPDQSQDSSDIETPGMIAAEKNPLTDTSTSDLTLDMLPGESIEQAKAHQDNNAKLELPLPMDAAQLHKEQATALSVPSLPNAAQPPTAATTTPVQTPLDDPNAPMPVSKAPQINPIRAPLANPYDILNR